VGSSDDGRTSIDHDAILSHDERGVRRSRGLDGLCGPERSCTRRLHGRP
jgi:hypothetical protein